MLSYLFFCGAVAGGAILAMGLIARSLPDGADRDVQIRSVAILMAAFATGLGVLGAVIGLSAQFIVTDGGDPTVSGGLAATLAVSFPALVLGAPGFAMFRMSGRNDVQGVARTLLMFAAGLGVLVVVVALVALLLEEGGGATEVDPIVFGLAIVAAIAAVGVGYVGSQAVTELGGAITLGEAVDAEVIRSRAVVRAAIFEGLGVFAVVGAFYFLFVEG